MLAKLNRILTMFEGIPIAIVFFNETNQVIKAKRKAEALFKCRDMNDLPANYFFPDWCENDYKSASAFMANITFFDRNGVPQEGEAVLFKLQANGKEAQGVAFRGRGVIGVT